MIMDVLIIQMILIRIIINLVYVAKNKIVESAVTGTPVVALCGKVWVPGRDPQKFPVCPDCKRILDEHWPSKDDGAGS